MIEPYSWQVTPICQIKHSLVAGRSILDGSDLGTGKSVHALMACKAGGKTPAIVCPKSTIPHWRELAKNLGMTPLFILNIEALKHGKGGVKFLETNGRDWRWNLPPGTVLIFDEVQRFSAPDSQNAKILASAARPVIMCSATAADSPIKLRAIGHQLGLFRWGDHWSWCGKMGCRKGEWGGLEFYGGDAVIQELHKQIFHTGRGVRVRIKDIPDYPENMVDTVLVPVGKQRAIDAAFVDALRLKSDHSPNAAVAMTRARQIAEHEKIPAVIELIEDRIDECNVVVFVNFLDSVHRIHTAFPECSMIYGDMDDSEREAEIRKFQEGGSHLLVATIQAGGEGINLPDLTGDRPRTSLILPGFSARDVRQAIGRIHRATSKSKCRQTLVFAEGTVEERVRTVVMAKCNNIDLLNDGDLTV